MSKTGERKVIPHFSRNVVPAHIMRTHTYRFFASRDYHNPSIYVGKEFHFLRLVLSRICWQQIVILLSHNSSWQQGDTLLSFETRTKFFTHRINFSVLKIKHDWDSLSCTCGIFEKRPFLRTFLSVLNLFNFHALLPLSQEHVYFLSHISNSQSKFPFGASRVPWCAGLWVDPVYPCNRRFGVNLLHQRCIIFMTSLRAGTNLFILCANIKKALRKIQGIHTSGQTAWK